MSISPANEKVSKLIVVEHEGSTYTSDVSLIFLQTRLFSQAFGKSYAIPLQKTK